MCLVWITLQHDWELTYSSARDGLSFNRLVHGIMGYSGPTLFVIRNSAGDVFGAYAGFVALCTRYDMHHRAPMGLYFVYFCLRAVRCPWKESNQFQGDGSCFLYTLKPHFRLLQPLTTSYAENHYMYLNTRGYQVRLVTQPSLLFFHVSWFVVGLICVCAIVFPQVEHGLGFGGKEGDLRIWLSAGFDDCRVQSFGHSYDYGKLCTPKPGTSRVRIQSCAVFGF